MAEYLTITNPTDISDPIIAEIINTTTQIDIMSATHNETLMNITSTIQDISHLNSAIFIIQIFMVGFFLIWLSLPKQRR
jgi:hypothetical protein